MVPSVSHFQDDPKQTKIIFWPPKFALRYFGSIKQSFSIQNILEDEESKKQNHCSFTHRYDKNWKTKIECPHLRAISSRIVVNCLAVIRVVCYRGIDSIRSFNFVLDCGLWFPAPSDPNIFKICDFIQFCGLFSSLFVNAWKSECLTYLAKLFVPWRPFILLLMHYGVDKNSQSKTVWPFLLILAWGQ